jgi:hypothetical protein
MMDRCKQQADNTASATASTAAAKTVYIRGAQQHCAKLFLQQIVHYVHARTITEKPPYLLIVLVAYNWLTVLSGAQ